MNGLCLDQSSLTEAAKVTNAWESYVHEKYSTPAEFRDYNKALSIQPEVARFYKANHENQTLEHVLAMKKRYGQLDKAWMGVWETLEILNGLIDDSDPDMGGITQITHALQAAEAARSEGLPRWFILTALIHDMGKLLYFFGEQQWTVNATPNVMYLKLTRAGFRWSVTHSPLAAGLQTTSYTASTLPITPTFMIRSIQLNMASTRLNVESTMSTFLTVTTSTCIRSVRATSRPRLCSSFATIPSLPVIVTGNTSGS